MSIDFTQWLWINWVILALTLGAFWTLGAWIVSTLLAALKRKPS